MHAMLELFYSLILAVNSLPTVDPGFNCSVSQMERKKLFTVGILTREQFVTVSAEGARVSTHTCTRVMTKLRLCPRHSRTLPVPWRTAPPSGDSIINERAAVCVGV